MIIMQEHNNQMSSISTSQGGNHIHNVNICFRLLEFGKHLGAKIRFFKTTVTSLFGNRSRWFYSRFHESNYYKKIKN